MSLCFCSFCKEAEEEESFNKENLLLSFSYDMAAKKRKKDLMNNNTKVPCESLLKTKKEAKYLARFKAWES